MNSTSTDFPHGADTPSPFAIPNPEQPSLRVLVVEDRPDDFDRVVEALCQSGLGIVAMRVDTEGALAYELNHQPTPDLILAAHGCEEFESFRILSCVRFFLQDVPFVLLTKGMSEGLMVKALDRGVDDWVGKHQLGDLLPAVLRAIRLAEERRRRRDAETERDWSNHQLAVLRGQNGLRHVVPICACCKKIRTGRDEWMPLEAYFDERHSIRFTHGYCTECVKTLDDQAEPTSSHQGAGTSIQFPRDDVILDLASHALPQS